VSAADKLDKARAIVADLRIDGPATLERFQGKRQTVWYFRKIANTFQKLKTGPIAAELEAAVREMERLTRRS
jgi:hypothetical protein